MASASPKGSGCLWGVLIALAWVSLFFIAVITEAFWLIMAAPLSIPAIILGYAVGAALARRR
ncbi:MAG TPA: hypothetical protein ENN88_02340 [Candidatus Coatesbacteria bacterium]|nr:hypothetical protein [Candidatus Coatesbacteria bacterium]